MHLGPGGKEKPSNSTPKGGLPLGPQSIGLHVQQLDFVQHSNDTLLTKRLLRLSCQLMGIHWAPPVGQMLYRALGMQTVRPTEGKILL